MFLFKYTGIRKRNTRQTRQTPSENIAKLVDDVKRLQAEKAALSSQLNEVQLELTIMREDQAKQAESRAQENVENGDMVLTAPCDSNKSSCQQNGSHKNEQVVSTVVSTLKFNDNGLKSDFGCKNFPWIFRMKVMGLHVNRNTNAG